MAPDASTSPVEWGPEIRVDGKRPEWLDGPFQYTASSGVTRWYGPVVGYSGWCHVGAIRLPADHPHYRQPTAPERDPALWDRMVALVRNMGETYRKADTPAELPTRNYDMRHYQEARNIQNLLPKPVDPDEREAEALIAARQWGENDTYAYQAVKLVVMDALRRCRELAGEQA